MTTPADMADAIRAASLEAGAGAPEVRGAEWSTATVTALGAGTVTCGVIVARRLDSYHSPTVGDRVYVAQSGMGNWIALGRAATTGDTWTNLTLAAGYINPGHGHTASWLREGRRIWLRGRIGRTGGATIPNNATIATMPAAILPAGGVDVGWAVARDATTYPASVRIDITTAGILRTYETDSLPTWIGLDGISYTI